VAVHVQSTAYGDTKNVDTLADGTALLEMGQLPPGSYDVSASLWTGTRTDAAGNLVTFPSSKTTMSLVVSESPCDGSAPATTTGKKGCGVGDANHQHNPKSGKTCPTK
jgi:hypothetical protein